MQAQYDSKAIPDLKGQTEPNQQQKGAEGSLKVPEFVIRDLGNDGPPVQLKGTQERVVVSVTQHPRPEQPIDIPDTSKPKSETPSETPIKSSDTLKPVEIETQSAAPKPVNINDGFYVFTWLNAHPTTVVSPPPLASAPARSHSRSQSGSSTNGTSHDETPSPKAGPEIQWNVNEEDVKSDLKEVDDFLASRSSLGDRLLYQECPVSSRGAVFEALEKAKRKIINATEKKDQEKLKVLESKSAILAASDLLFQFFLPSGFEGPTVEKFWGALDALLFVSFQRL